MAILEKSRPRRSVLDIGSEERDEFLIRKLQAQGVEAAYLFGSCADGTAGAWSDIDLVIVAESSRPFLERPRDFADLFELGVPLDILVYTPDEFAAMQHNQQQCGFWRTFAMAHRRLV